MKAIKSKRPIEKVRVWKRNEEEKKGRKKKKNGGKIVEQKYNNRMDVFKAEQEREGEKVFFNYFVLSVTLSVSKFCETVLCLMRKTKKYLKERKRVRRIAKEVRKGEREITGTVSLGTEMMLRTWWKGRQKMKMYSKMIVPFNRSNGSNIFFRDQLLFYC